MFASTTFNFYIMIYGFEFSINKVTASLKPCLWPKTDTANVKLGHTFKNQHFWNSSCDDREQMSIKPLFLTFI